jgi:hypothetical protein
MMQSTILSAIAEDNITKIAPDKNENEPIGIQKRLAGTLALNWLVKYSRYIRSLL